MWPHGMAGLASSQPHVSLLPVVPPGGLTSCRQGPQEVPDTRAGSSPGPPGAGGEGATRGPQEVLVLAPSHLFM